MSYEPTNWKTGDIVTSQKLNKLEQGVAGAGGAGGFLKVTIDEGTGAFDKTWKEISDALADGCHCAVVLEDPIMQLFIIKSEISEEMYYVTIHNPYTADNIEAVTDSENGYPVTQGD